MIIVGSLARQNWHRQVRERNLDETGATEYVIDKTAAVAREFGFDPMAIQLRPVASVPDIRARVQDAGLTPIYGIQGIGLTNDPQIRADVIESAKRGLEDTVELGAKIAMVSLEPNPRVTHLGHLARAADILHELGSLAAPLGVTLGIEEMSLFNSDELVHVFTQVDLENVGLVNDTGNWLILGEDPLEATKKLLPHTVYAHVRDYALENQTYTGVALGDGLVDFDSVLPVLATLGEKKDIVFTMELDTDTRDEDDAVRTSYGYLQNWLAAH